MIELKPSQQRQAPPPKPVRSKKRRTSLWVAAAAVAALAYMGIAPRRQASQKLQQEVLQQEKATPVVSVVQLRPVVDKAALTLPSTIQALEQTAIGARTNGYLSARYVDIGSHVKQGQVLATIEAPEVDQQLSQADADVTRAVANSDQASADESRLQAGQAQARAQLAGAQSDLGASRSEVVHDQAKLTEAQGAESEAEAKLRQAEKLESGKEADLARAKARLNLAKKTYDRWKLLAKGGAVSGQDLDETQEAFESSGDAVTGAQADVESAKADVVAAQSAFEARKGDVAAATADIVSAKEKLGAAGSAVESFRANVSAAGAAVRAGLANVGASRATIEASQSNRGRVAALKSFESVRAPFDGVITARNVDVGDLIGPTAVSGDQTNPVGKSGLFSIAREDTLRVQVNVPEAYLTDIKMGQEADVQVQERPGRWFSGSIFHIADAVDAASRTELIEVRVPNETQMLHPGMYAQVRFTGAAGQGISVQIPATALIYDAQGTRVAVVTPDNKIKMIHITPGHDYGDTIEVLVGLTGHERVVSNPDPTLQDGEEVTIAPGRVQ